MSTPFPDLSRWMRGAGSAQCHGHLRVPLFGRNAFRRFLSRRDTSCPPFGISRSPAGATWIFWCAFPTRAPIRAFWMRLRGRRKSKKAATGFSWRTPGPLHMQYNPDSAVFSLIDTERGEAWYHARSLPDIPWYEKSAPMRMIMHWMCETHGMTLVHAGAVSCGSSCILLTGKGAPASRPRAVSCALSGMRYLGDDYIVLMRTGPPMRPACTAAPKSAKTCSGGFLRSPSRFPAPTGRRPSCSSRRLVRPMRASPCPCRPSWPRRFRTAGRACAEFRESWPSPRYLQYHFPDARQRKVHF